jgi:nitroreductase
MAEKMIPLYIELLQPGRFLFYSNGMNIFNSLLFSRRSRRSFLDRPVEKEKTEELIEAALGIAVAADTEKSDVWIEDASIASIDIQMAAEALGLASCWVQIRRRKTPADESSSRAAALLLNLPGQFEVLSLIAVGYSEEKREPRTGRELSREHVYREQYGTDYSS